MDGICNPFHQTSGFWNNKRSRNVIDLPNHRLASSLALRHQQHLKSSRQGCPSALVKSLLPHFRTLQLLIIAASMHSYSRLPPNSPTMKPVEEASCPHGHGLLPESLTDDLGFDGGVSLYEKKCILINREIDSHGMGRYQWYIWFLCGFGYLLDLLWAQAFGLVLSPIQQEFGFSSTIDSIAYG